MSFHKDLLGADLHPPSNFFVLNNSGSTIPALRVVKSNSFSTAPEIIPITSTSDRPVGVTKTSIANGATGTIVGIGLLDNVDTSSFPAGSTVFATSTGILTLTDTGLFVGTVLVQNASTGVIFVSINLQGSQGIPGAGAVVGVVLVTPVSQTAHPSIVSALSAATPGDVVIVGPGTYAESLTVPANVTLRAAYGFLATNITGSLATGTRVTLSNDSVIEGFDVSLPTDATPAILYAGSTSAAMRRMRTSGVNTTSTAVRVTSGSLTSVENRHTGAANIVYDVDGGSLNLAVSTVLPVGTINTSVRVVNGGVLNVATFLSDTVGGAGTVGLLVGDGTVRGNGARFVGSESAVRVTSNLADVQIRSTKIDGTVNDLLVDAGLTNGVFHFVAGEMTAEKISAPTAWRMGADRLFSFQDENTDGEVAFRVSGDLSVGTHVLGAASHLGQGESHTTGIRVFQNDNLDVGTFTDITAAMDSPTGSAIALFNGTTPNRTVFFGADMPFFGIRPNVTVAINLGAGALIWEFWDGVTWKAVNIMVADSDNPFNQYAEDAFGRVAFEHVRTGDTSTMALLNLNGATKYWLRVRISSAIVASPTVEQVRLETSRTEITKDGSLSFFGDARLIRQLDWKRELLVDQAGASPANENITVSTNITLAATDNRFNNGVVDARAGIIEMPTGLDTSLSLQLVVDWFSLATGGDIELEVDFAIITEGDIIDGTLPESRVSQIITVPGTLRTLVRTIFDIPVNNIIPKDSLGIRIFRDATGSNLDDTLVGNIVLVETRLFGHFWR